MTKVFVSIFISLIFLGCSEETNTKIIKEASYKAGAYLTFDSLNGNIPYPNNILFANSKDGTLNINYEESDSDASVKSALNTLDGFSTTSPISIGFSGEINPSTLAGGVKFYEISAESSTATGGVPVINAITGELTYGVDYVATISDKKIVILPTRPLKGSQNYMIVLTKDITDNSDRAIANDLVSELFLNETPLINSDGSMNVTLDADTARQLEGIRQATQAMISYTVAQKSIEKSDIVTAWSFKTQSIGKLSNIFANNVTSASLSLSDTGYTSKDLLSAAGADINSMQGMADVYAGTLSNIPYYLAKASSTHDTAPLTRSFNITDDSSLPDLNATISIPVLAVVPNNLGSMPVTGWPAVIFQHGITQNRTNLLAISEAIVGAGYAAVAIDLPLHGIDDNSSVLYMSSLERTFDLDLVNNTTYYPGPDGVTDISGTHYINLSSLLTSRDNIRQSTSDLLALKNTLSKENIGIKFDTTKIAFIGHSLGTIAAFGFLDNATNLNSVTLAMPGGGIAELLNNSAEFGPLIEAGLAGQGVMKGSDEYSAFMLAAQTILDDADPVNYASSVGGKQNIFALEVVGNSTDGTDDQVIPNSVSTAPLSGTEPLLSLLGTTNLTNTSAPNKAARFTIVDHNSFLDPSASATATSEMQKETLSFLLSGGTQISVENTYILYNP